MLYEYDKLMIILSRSDDEANEYLENKGLLTVEDKISFLEKMFDIQLISRKDEKNTTYEESEKMDLYALLHTIRTTN